MIKMRKSSFVSKVLSVVLISLPASAWAWGGHLNDIRDDIFKTNVTLTEKAFTDRLVAAGRIALVSGETLVLGTPQFLDGDRSAMNGAESLWSVEVGKQVGGAVEETQLLFRSHIACVVEERVSGGRGGTQRSYMTHCHVIGDRSGD